MLKILLISLSLLTANCSFAADDSKNSVDNLPMDTEGVSRKPGNKYFAAAMALLRKEPHDDKEIFNLFSKAASYKHCQSYGYLGQMYLQGKGVTADYAKAIDNFHQGSFCNDMQSLYALGYCFEQGLGVPVNIDYATNLYNSAASKGYAPAKFALALIYLRSDDKHDLAIDLIQAAAKKRYGPAIDYYYKNIYGDSKTKKKD